MIVPPEFLTVRDPKIQIQNAFKPVLPKFAKSVKEGDIIVADTNFGCGSSREEAVYVLKELGIHYIIASSFARIFYRNCFNLGIAAIILPNANEILKNKKILSIELEVGKIITENEIIEFKPIPKFLIEMVNASGALKLIQKKNGI